MKLHLYKSNGIWICAEYKGSNLIMGTGDSAYFAFENAIGNSYFWHLMTTRF